MVVLTAEGYGSVKEIKGARALQVSVVVPVRNEEKTLPFLIESLRRQTLAPREVIIVDGGSTDETVSLAGHLTKGDHRFRVIEAGGAATPGRGRNIGIAAARYEWVALTDAGIRLEATWLERLAQVIENDSSIEVVYGNYEPVTNTLFERCAALAYPPPKQKRAGGWMRGPSIASTLLRREVWQRVGGFPDLRAAEDLIFMERIERKGIKVGWSPSATVWWQLQPSLGRTFRKFVLYSRHNVWAGRQYDWHHGIARQYTLWLVFVGLAVAHRSPWWLAGPALGFAARTAKSVWRRREGRGLLWALNPVQLIGVGAVLLVIDVATFVGWAQAAAWPRAAQPTTPPSSPSPAATPTSTTIGEGEP